MNVVWWLQDDNLKINSVHHWWMSTGYYISVKDPGLSWTSPDNIKSSKRNIVREKTRFVKSSKVTENNSSLHAPTFKLA